MKVKFYGKNGSCLAQLNSEKDSSNLFETCTVDKKIQVMADGELSIRCELPILDMHGFWSPGMFRPAMKLGWRIEFS
ncbi:MAG: hypothetical protein WCV67_13380 [Victivallaceae bacterium]|jgi:hypothetical protein